MRIGFGYDVHELVEGRELIIGGVCIDHEKGLLGHSDADVLVHSIMDSILGALALGDIGAHFPDTDPKYKDISSLILLENVKKAMDIKNYKIGNIDATIAAQSPKLSPFIEEMRKNIANILGCSLEDINIKATTTEKLGFVGRKEGISSYSVCLLESL
ncbi:MAG: 2-C-methyl-D-erythritol 2,4-cyclodiphosphate synthase [Tissierella sp.]|uniref:2-C-methyl-D-erythritol 2,4-cyclodiphosphate synthase n=1 Tax=Tissierella sp. TaxID=41274 RepID=UPI003F9AE386